mmetsp:Transcript_59657/g.94721  ORF Transcript_59657/g.94721 Transcript_59657/m.94721 type:complete len:504 (-) Transcript_59657:328-1839(-)
MVMNVLGALPFPVVSLGVPPAAAVPSGPLVMTPQPQASRFSSREIELQPGVEVSLGQYKFRILNLLGRGSFSAVWNAARLDGGGEVAIKETLCRSQQELQDAENEARILQMVGSVALRISSFIACETMPLHSGTTSVRLAMAKVSGDTVGTFLQQRRKQWIGDSNFQFLEACSFTYELLAQLVPALDAISAVALHRDINTHNLLVSTACGSSVPQFSIIDFGLAVDVHSWPTQHTKVPVAGDCRYWPVSSWYIFAHGGPKLTEMPSLVMEYRTQLDLHALGITALQVFIDMLPQQSVSAIPEEIRALKVAWDQYWQDASRLHEPVFKAPDLHTLMQLRHSYIATEAHNIIDRDLGQLRRSLFAARDACARREPGSKAAMIFSVLAELISQGAKPLESEAARSSIKLASWSDIGNLLSNDSGSRGGATTTILGRIGSSTALPLPMKTWLNGSTSTTAPPSCVSATTHHIPPTWSMHSPTNMHSPTVVISSAVPMSQMSFVPVLR